MNKDQLRTEIEKTFQRLITDQIKEQVVDFSVLWVQRNKLAVDRDSMAKVLDVVRIAIDDAYYKNIDVAMNMLEPKLQEFVDDANPLAPTK